MSKKKKNGNGNESKNELEDKKSYTKKRVTITAKSPNQSDICGTNGLVDAVKRLKGVNNLGIVEFSKEDILRNPIVADVEERYKTDF